MKLRPTPKPSWPAVVVAQGAVSQVQIHPDGQIAWVSQSENGRAVTPALQLIQISLAVCQHIQARGAVLLHGALAEIEGNGVVLAGRGGIGKTTASRRLRPPWSSLSDDATLVVRDADGGYWAHPWPTWSQFVAGEPERSWDVQSAVRLRGIFFLVRAGLDLAAPLGAGHAVALLVESSEQVWWGMAPLLSREALRASRLQRLDNISDLVKAVPSYTLDFSAMGMFWKEIERVLEGRETS